MEVKVQGLAWSLHNKKLGWAKSDVPCSESALVLSSKDILGAGTGP